MEVLQGLRYKLRMMGVPIEGPTHMYGDNMSTIHNTQHPESQLKKKSNSICYHAVREAMAMLTGHICMEVTCQPFTTLNTLSLSLRRNPTVFVIMLLEKPWQWESC